MAKSNNIYNKVVGCIIVMFCLLLQPQFTFAIPMTFNELHSGHDECDCIASAQQNCYEYFARIASGNGLRSGDFKLSGKNKKAEFTNCKRWCGQKSLSVSVWNDKSKETVLKVLKESQELAPEFKKVLCIFKIRKHGGYVKHTPSQKNKYHYDYYYPDNYRTNLAACLEYIDTIKNENS